MGGSGGTITTSTGSVTLTTSFAGSSTYSRAISRPVSLVKQGSGTLLLSGATATAVHHARRRHDQVGKHSRLGSATGSLTVNGGTLDLNGLLNPAVGGAGRQRRHDYHQHRLRVGAHHQLRRLVGLRRRDSCAVGFYKQGSGTLTWRLEHVQRLHGGVHRRDRSDGCDPEQRRGRRRHRREPHDCRYGTTVRHRRAGGRRGDGNPHADRRQQHRLRHPFVARGLVPTARTP